MDDMPESWHYPGSRAGDVDAVESAVNVDPELVEEQQTQPELNGLWGVSLGDTLVAIVCDLALHSGWVDSTAEDEAAAVDAGPSLVAGLNLIVHSLTRTGTVARRRALPAWVKRRPQPAEGPAALDTSTATAAFAADDQVDPGLYDALDGSIAIVRSPLGDVFGPGGIGIRIDGRYRIDLLNGNLNGVLLHNLPAGSHWVEVEHQGSREGIDVVLRGGKVATVTFGVSRLAMVSRVRIQVQEDQVRTEAWKRSFSDLFLDEVFLQEDEELLPALE
jgi:hypothetical protein